MVIAHNVKEEYDKMKKLIKGKSLEDKIPFHENLVIKTEFFINVETYGELKAIVDYNKPRWACMDEISDIVGEELAVSEYTSECKVDDDYTDSDIYMPCPICGTSTEPVNSLEHYCMACHCCGYRTGYKEV